MYIIISLYSDIIHCSIAMLGPSESLPCGIPCFWHDSVYLCFCFSYLFHSHMLRTIVPRDIIIPNTLWLGGNMKYISEREGLGSSPAIQ